MKRHHLFLFLSCLILVIVYFGITRPIREPVIVNCDDPCYTAYTTTDLMSGPPDLGKECPMECPICVYTPESGPPINLINNRISDQSIPGNNEDNSKIGTCIPDSLAPANLLNYISPNPIAEFSHQQTFNTNPIDMTQVETTVAQIATVRLFAPDGTWLEHYPQQVQAGPEQRLYDINFLGYFLLFMQGLNPPNPPGVGLTRFVIDNHFRLPYTTIPDVLQLQQANIDPTQQVAVKIPDINFPGVVGNTLMLPMIPIVPSSSTRSGVVDPAILSMFELNPSGTQHPSFGPRQHIDIYNTQIRPAINELLLRLTPEFQAQQRLAFATALSEGSQSSLQSLPPDVINTIGNNLRQRAMPMPNLVQRQGIFRVSFLHNGQSTDLQTVIRQALYPAQSSTTELTDQQRMSIILWIFRRFTELSATCGKSPSPPGGSDHGGDDGDGTGGGPGGISEGVPPSSRRRSLRF